MVNYILVYMWSIRQFQNDASFYSGHLIGKLTLPFKRK